MADYRFEVYLVLLAGFLEFVRAVKQKEPSPLLHSFCVLSRNRDIYYAVKAAVFGAYKVDSYDGRRVSSQLMGA